MENNVGPWTGAEMKLPCLRGGIVKGQHCTARDQDRQGSWGNRLSPLWAEGIQAPHPCPHMERIGPLDSTALLPNEANPLGRGHFQAPETLEKQEKFLLDSKWGGGGEELHLTKRDYDN